MRLSASRAPRFRPIAKTHALYRSMNPAKLMWKAAAWRVLDDLRAAEAKRVAFPVPVPLAARSTLALSATDAPGGRFPAGGAAGARSNLRLQLAAEAPRGRPAPRAHAAWNAHVWRAAAAAEQALTTHYGDPLDLLVQALQAYRADPAVMATAADALRRLMAAEQQRTPQGGAAWATPEVRLRNDPHCAALCRTAPHCAALRRTVLRYTAL